MTFPGSSSQNNVDLRITMQVDPALAAQSQAQLAAVNQAFDTMAQRAVNASRLIRDAYGVPFPIQQVSDSIGAAGDAAAKAGDQAEQAAKGWNDWYAAQQQVVNAPVPQPSGDGGGGGSSGGFNPSRMGSAMRVGGMLATQAGASELGSVLRVGGEIERLDGALSAMGINIGGLAEVAGPLAIVIGGVALAMKGLNDITKEAKDNLGIAIKTQEDYYKVVEGGTTTDVKKRIGELSMSTDASQKSLTDIVNTTIAGLRSDRTRDTSDISPDAIKGMSINQQAQLLIDNYGGGSALTDDQKKALQDLTSTIKTNQEEVWKLNNALVNGATVTNDNIKAIQTESDARAKYFAFAKTATNEQLQAEKDRIAAEQAAIKSQMDELTKLNTPQATAALAELQDKMDKDTISLNILNNEFSDAIKKNNDYREGLKQVSDTITNGLKGIGQFFDISGQMFQLQESRAVQLANEQKQAGRAAIENDLNARIADAQAAEKEAAAVQKVADLKTQFADAEAQAIAEHNAAVDQLGQDHMTAQLDALSKFQDSELQYQQDYAIKRAQQLQDLYNQLLGFEASRDVAGFISARNAGLTNIARGDQGEATADQRRVKAFADQQRTADQAYIKQLDALNASFDKQDAARQAQYDKQLAQLEAATNIQLTESQKLQDQLKALKAQWAEQDKQAAQQAEADKFNAEIRQLQQERDAAAPFLASLFDAPLQSVANFASGANQILNNLVNSVGGVTSTLAYQTTIDQAGAALGMPGFASGISYVPYDMAAIIHRGEKITRAVDNHGGDSAINFGDITIGNGMSREEVVGEIRQLGRDISGALRQGRRSLNGFAG